MTYLFSGKKLLSTVCEFSILMFQGSGNLGLQGNSWHKLPVAANCFSDKKQEVMKDVLRS